MQYQALISFSADKNKDKNKMKIIHISKNQKNFKYSSDGKTLYRIGKGKVYVYHLENKDKFGPAEFYHFSHTREYIPSRYWYLFS